MPEPCGRPTVSGPRFSQSRGLSPDRPSRAYAQPPRFLGALRHPPVNLPATLAGFPPHSPQFASCHAPHAGTRSNSTILSQPNPMNMTLPSDNGDLASLFIDEHHSHHHSHAPIRHDYGCSAPRPEVMSPSSTELSDDSSLTNDDLVVLSDLFGFANSAGPQPLQPRVRSAARPPVRAAASVRAPR